MAKTPKTPKSGYTETIDGIELQADPSLEGLDDIEGPIDDAWAEEVRKMTVRTTRRDSKKERRIPPSTSEPEAPFSLYYARRKKEQRKAITARRDAARLRGLMQNAVDDSLSASLKHLTGQHAQKRHGARQGSTPPSKMFDPPRSAARFRRENRQQEESPVVPDVVGALTRGMRVGGSDAQNAVHDKLVDMEDRLGSFNSKRAGDLTNKMAITRIHDKVASTLARVEKRPAPPPTPKDRILATDRLHRELMRDLSKLTEHIRSRGDKMGGDELWSIKRDLDSVFD